MTRGDAWTKGSRMWVAKRPGWATASRRATASALARWPPPVSATRKSRCRGGAEGPLLAVASFGEVVAAGAVCAVTAPGPESGTDYNASSIPYPVTAMHPPEPLAGSPSAGRRALAVVSVHASPLGPLGQGENGGMNLSIRRLCEGLAARGVPSDVFVRRDDPRAPAEELICSGSRLVRLPVGPPEPLPKEAVLGHLPAFTTALLAHAASENREYRLVHCHYWLSGWGASRALQRSSVPAGHS